jgi:hypothetical protein
LLFFSIKNIKNNGGQIFLLFSSIKNNGGQEFFYFFPPLKIMAGKIFLLFSSIKNIKQYFCCIPPSKTSKTIRPRFFTVFLHQKHQQQYVQDFLLFSSIKNNDGQDFLLFFSIKKELFG